MLLKVAVATNRVVGSIEDWRVDWVESSFAPVLKIFVSYILSDSSSLEFKEASWPNSPSTIQC